jgi:AbrB family looped-hinge helix DNA binding protein
MSARDEAGGRNSEATALVALSPYAETPLFFRTTFKVEGAQRWFEKTRVFVVSRDKDRIVLAMPKSYADTRAGIASLVVEPSDASLSALPAPSEARAGGFDESAAEWDAGLPERLDLQVGPAGRIVIPSVFRDAMQIREGDRLMARVVDGELRLISPSMAVRLAQKLVRETIPGDDSLADELIEERKREFKRELSGG